jgi:M6 family metalloprotease-like protein
LSLLPVFTFVTGTLPAAAQQPTERPAPWSAGATPPAAILGLNDARPVLPLEFSRAWLGKVEQVRIRREELAAAGSLDGMTPADLARAGAALTGTLRIPVIPIRYADVAVPFDTGALAERLFGAAHGDTMSFAGFWDEVSGGLLKVEGDVAPWITLRRPASHYLPARQFGWSSFGRVVELRDEALAAAGAHVDWRRFDNDGSDGVPDSGDDDGYVDFVALMYALPCPGDARAGAIWPHRAAMTPVETDVIGASGEPIRIADYVVLAAVDPATCGPLQVGVLAHETGHALGLPDLYDYDGSSQGIGAWGLMGSGSHAAHHSPAHPGAWEKEQLGWIGVKWLTPADSAIRLEPVQAARMALRYDAGGGDYFLLENRQRSGSDRFLPAGGLLVWRVSPDRAELGAWNNDERRPAVGVVQADGRGDLGRGLRADAGDPFPGRTRRTAFLSAHVGGLRLSGIRQDGLTIRAHLNAAPSDPALVPQLEVIRMTALDGGAPVRQSIDIHRTIPGATRWAPGPAASWLRAERVDDALVLTADPAGLIAGTYTDTVDLRVADQTLARVVISFYLASGGVAQVIATELPWSWGVAVHGGRMLQASYGWDQLGLRPRPRVLQLWEGASHPQTLSRLAADALYAPIVDPRDGAAFVLARAVDGNYLYRILGNGDAELVAARIGRDPAYGAAILPDGSIAVAEWNGRISRVTRDGAVTPWLDLAANIYQIASDRDGNVYAALYSGNVMRIAAGGEYQILLTDFGAGRLVSVATTPDGAVIAAERGGQGRIVRLAADGARDVVYQSPGARFYGLAADDVFLYALDLTGRQLLRIPLPAARPVQRMYSRNSAPTAQQ